MSESLREMNLHPLPFTGRLLYFIKWLLAPRQADSIAQMSWRSPATWEEETFELTALPPEPVQLGGASLLAEAMFYDVVEAMEDRWHGRIFYGSDIVWEWFCWLTLQISVQSRRGNLRQNILDAPHTEMFEQRLDQYLQKHFGSWWYKPVSVQLPHDHTLLDEAFWSLFHSLLQWNTQPYDSMQLLRALYPVLRDYQTMYVQVSRAQITAYQSHLSSIKVPLCSLLVDEEDNLMGRIASRLVYLSAFLIATSVGEWDISEREDYPAQLQRICKVLPLLASWVGREPCYSTVSDQYPLKLWKDFVVFWDWYVEQIMLKVDSSPVTPEDNGADIFCDLVAGFWNDQLLRTLGDFWFGRPDWGQEGTPSMPNDVLQWMQRFAVCPFEPYQLLWELTELEACIWQILKRFLTDALGRTFSQDR